MTKEMLVYCILYAFAFTLLLAALVEALSWKERKRIKKEREIYKKAKQRIKDGKGWDDK
jgi:uncharacterized protein (DUF58 family)